MEKTKISIAILRVIVAFCILLFALSYLNLSFGWFSDSKIVNAGGSYVKVGIDKSVNLVSCHVFRYTDNGVVCSDATDSQSYEMMKYDTILTDKNVNTPLFLRVTAEGIPSDGRFTVTVPLTEGTAPYKLSDVISVKVAFGLKIDGDVSADAFTPDSDNSGKGDNVKIFGGVRDLVKSDEYKNVNYLESTFGGQQKITFTLDSALYKDYMCAIENGVCDYTAETKNALVFYVVFDYDEDLISEFLKNEVSISEITFSNDIGTITIE